MHDQDIIKKLQTLRAIKPNEDWVFSTRQQILTHARQTHQEQFSIFNFQFPKLLFQVPSLKFQALSAVTVAVFVLAVVVSFVFQKFWTFQDHSRDFIHKQAWTYLFVAVTNTIINTIFVYSLVEYAGFHYLWAQFVSNVIIACESFFVYKKFIFHTKII